MMERPGAGWPDLDLPAFADTMTTLHLWSQVVGKVKLAALPWLNESWHVPLYVSGTGLTTGLVTHADLGFELMFDFTAGELRLAVSDGGGATMPLASTSVAAFHAAVLAALADGGIDLRLTTRPSEIAGALPFAEDTERRVFDLDAARAWWRALVQMQRIYHRFRSRFTGKCSPIHLFWGGFDLALTFFSGRSAPRVEHGAPNMSVAVMQDAYADELASFGFWPGGGGVEGAHLYLETWPDLDGLDATDLARTGATFDQPSGQWRLSYAAARASGDPDGAFLTFLETGYDAIADIGQWPRDRLERAEGPIGRPPPLRAG